MEHIDARAALDNRFLMKLFKQVEDTALSNLDGAAYTDTTTPLVSKAERATIRLLREELESACGVEKDKPKKRYRNRPAKENLDE